MEGVKGRSCITYTEEMLVNSSDTCLIEWPHSIFFLTFYITNIAFLLPLSIFILYHGLQEWQKQRFNLTMATRSHSDCFTYHLVTMELIGLINNIADCYGIYAKNLHILHENKFVTTFVWHGQTFFHFLTCLERYLAVVHPITYRSLRNRKGIRIRNISIGCVWLLSLLATGLFNFRENLLIVDLCLLMLVLVAVTFCSFSVIFVLIRPGPGQKGMGKVDQSKLRAFYTILAILVVLLMRFASGLVWAVLSISEGKYMCLIMIVGTWFNLPSGLLLPVLFLHRAGKFGWCQTK